MEDADNAMILLYDLCRLCLDEPGVINIFKPVDWTEDILTYTGIQVTTLDKFPQTICSSCRDIMTCVKILKDIALANDNRLRLIRGSNDSQVLNTDSCSHLVIISSCTACDDQNESREVSEVLSASSDFKSRIVFESEDETAKEPNTPEKKSRRKRKSNSISSAPKTIQVRKDLFNTSVSSATVTSTKKTEESPTSTCSTNKDPDKRDKTSTKKSQQTPTSTSDLSNKPEKIVTVDGKKIKLDEFEHKCETCNKTYATPKKLYFHQMAHNKKFYCPLDACCKKFATKGDLQKHIRSHTGEKPYKCDLCDLSFTQNVTLKSHKEKKHNEPKR